jgi:hypothetical protein
MAESAPSSIRLVAVAVRGSSHIREGKPCEDSFRFIVMLDGSVVIAVGDGAGTADLAGLGSRLAVDTAIASLQQSVKDESRLIAAEPMRTRTQRGSGVQVPVLIQAFEETHSALRREAATQECDLRALNTTLLLALISPHGDVQAGQVGDGAVVCYRDGHYELVTGPPETEYANETYFITQQDWRDHLAVGRSETPAEMIALFSDGIQRLALSRSDHQWRPRAGFLAPLHEHLAKAPSVESVSEDIKVLFRSDSVRRHTADDLSLVMVTR